MLMLMLWGISGHVYFLFSLLLITVGIWSLKIRKKGTTGVLGRVFFSFLFFISLFSFFFSLSCSALMTTTTNVHIIDRWIWIWISKSMSPCE